MKIWPYFLLILVYLTKSWAAGVGGGFNPILGVSLGMVNVSLTENVTDLKGTSTSTTTTKAAPESTNVAATSIELTYDFMNFATKSVFGRFVAPVISQNGTGLFLLSSGVNFFFNDMSSIFNYSDSDARLKVTPMMRYYLGFSVGAGFLVYTTSSAKKSDVGLDVGAHAGGSYNVSQKMAIKLELGMSKGFGVATSSMNMKIFVGAIYYVDI